MDASSSGGDLRLVLLSLTAFSRTLDEGELLACLDEGLKMVEGGRGKSAAVGVGGAGIGGPKKEVISVVNDWAGLDGDMRRGEEEGERWRISWSSGRGRSEGCDMEGMVGLCC